MAYMLELTITAQKDVTNDGPSTQNTYTAVREALAALSTHFNGGNCQMEDDLHMRLPSGKVYAHWKFSGE
jgi:hypothetical protein